MSEKKDINKRVKRVRPSKVITVKLDGEYEGWTLDVRTPVPLGILGKMFSAYDAISKAGEDARDGQLDAVMLTLDFLKKITVGWNFVGYEGEPMPLSEESWEEIDLDLLMVAVRRVNEELTTVPLVS